MLAVSSEAVQASELLKMLGWSALISLLRKKNSFCIFCGVGKSSKSWTSYINKYIKYHHVRRTYFGCWTCIVCVAVALRSSFYSASFFSFHVDNNRLTIYVTNWSCFCPSQTHRQTFAHRSTLSGYHTHIPKLLWTYFSSFLAIFLCLSSLDAVLLFHFIFFNVFCFFSSSS